jgi:trehalose/maltose hydrolase-like predicted phosphorylase
MDAAWTLTESVFSPATSLAYEGLFTQGSGTIHARGSIEEHFTDSPQHTTYLRMPGNVTAEKFPVTQSKWGTYVPGIFGQHPTLNREMVNLPFFWLLIPTVDGERLDMIRCSICAYSRSLNLRNGTLTRSFQWSTRSGAQVSVSFERFIDAARPHLAVQRMRLQADRPISLHLQTGIDSDIRTSGFDHLTQRELAPLCADGLTCRVVTDLGEQVCLASRVAPSPLTWQHETTERQGFLTGTIALAAGVPLLIERHTVVSSSRDLTPVNADVELRESLAAGYDALAAENDRFWQVRWQKSDVIVEGDPESQRALRCSLYHLLRCHVPGDARVAIDAKGYAGDAYFGRFFWDTEMYIFPFYLYTDPDRARTFVDFRVQGLNGARANAAAYGYPGARYPWESDPEGGEHCPNWQYRDHEIHITGDVVYAMAHFDRACPLSGFLSGKAAEAVVETARYWMARIDYRDGETTPSLLGVMGPDEYSPITSNNAYTNRGAAFALALAAGDTGRAGGASDTEREAFATVARTLPIPRRADGKLILQCEEFEHLADPRFDILWKDRSRGYANNVSQERLYRSKAMKQADVLMLMMLFPAEFSEAEVAAAWNYYLPFTTHDSSLSSGAHAIVACRLGYAREAWRFWLKTINNDLDIGHGGAAEGIHIANAAASWMVAVLGFAGVGTVMETEMLTLRPALPAAWKRLAFPLVWKGVPLQVELTADTAAVTNRGKGPISVRIQECVHPLAAGATVRVPYARRDVGTGVPRTEG